MINRLVKLKDKSIIPKWFLRQSGRHIPEYFSIRDKHKNFIDYSPAPWDGNPLSMKANEIVNFKADGFNIIIPASG